MKIKTTRRLSGASAFTFAVLVGVAATQPPAWAVTAPPRVGRDFQALALDVRLNDSKSFHRALAARPGISARITEQSRSQANSLAAAARQLNATLPGLKIGLSPLTGAAESVTNTRGALTGPAPGRGSEAIVREFLGRQGALYGLSRNDLADLVAIGDSAGGKSGLRMLRMEQNIDGRRVFQSETRFALDRSGRLVKSTGTFVPAARSQIAPFAPGSLISPQDAVVRLLASTGETSVATAFVPAAPVDQRILLTENDPHVAGAITAREVLFPLAPGVLVPAWSLVVATEGDHDWYGVIDAVTGDVLWRKDIRSHASTQDARFSVYVQADGVTPADSPAPASPTTALPGAGTQFPAIARTTVSMFDAQDLVASPDGWIPDGGSTTTGNNVDACLDRVGTAGEVNVCDVGTIDNNGRPVGNTDLALNNRDFLGLALRDYSYTPAPLVANPDAGDTPTGTAAAQVNFRRGATTHLFYLTNWYHDRMFQLGFDEASANFQQANFTAQGAGNDRVLADVQDSSGTNNANFSTPPDGTSGRMQMYRFTGPAPDRDGDLDAEIVIHELTHGLSNRLIGNAEGMFWGPARGMGEGWSDFFALSLLNATNADDPGASYSSGSYATYRLGGLTDNYVYGIRRFPFSTDNTVNPMTWGDVDDVTANYAGGLPISPLGFEFNGAFEEHNVGELWTLSLWEMRSRIIADPAGAAGDVPAGNETAMQLVTDGLKMTPNHPSFVSARDALIDADCATNNCANEQWIWEGFADRGLGYGAVAPLGHQGYANLGHMSIGESFAVPALEVQDPATDVVIDDSNGNNNGQIDPGEPIRLTVSLRNPWRAAGKAVASASATLSSATPGITIYDNASAYGAIAPQGKTAGDTFFFTVPTSAACGSRIDLSLSVNSSLGAQTAPLSLRIGQANGTDPVVTYTRASAVPIIDNDPRGAGNTLSVADDLVIADVDFRVDNLAHTFTGDLTVLLRGPDGYGSDLIWLREALFGGGDGDNFINTVIDDSAVNDLNQTAAAQAPFTGSFKPAFSSPVWLLFGDPSIFPDPVGPLSRYNGKSTRGDWRVNVADMFSQDAGTLNSWSLLVTPVHFDCVAFVPSVTMSATKTVAGTFRTGGTVNYTVTLTNTGTTGQADNPGNEFTDVLPAGLTLVSATASSGAAVATVATNQVTWNGALAPLGGSTTITITATVNAGTHGTQMSNQGTVSFDADGNGTNEAPAQTDDPGVAGASNPTVFLVQSSNVSGTLAAAGPFTRSSTVVYTATLSNSGTAAAPDNAGNEFTNVLPAGLTLVSATASSGTATATVGTGTTTWNGSVPAGGSVTITITASVGAAASGVLANQGSLSFDADVDGTNESTGATDDPSTAAQGDATSFLVQFAQVGGTKAAAGPFTRGSTVTYTIALTNNGTATAGDNAGAELTDVLPATLTLVSANATSGTATATIASNTVAWNGSLAAGAGVTITITATVNANTLANVVSNQATIAFDSNVDGGNDGTAVTDDPGTVAANDATSFTVVGAQLAANKTVSGTFLPGQLVTYVIALRNDGNIASGDNPGHEVTDTLPTTLNLVSATAPQGAISAVGDTVFWDGSLNAGASVSITIVARIAASATGTISNQASISFDSDNNAINDTTVASDDPAIAGSANPTAFSLSGADLQITKSNGVSFVTSGSDTVYTIQVSNGGPEAVTGARIRDLLPLTLRNAEWTCTAVGTTCPVPGTTGNIDVTVDLPVNAVMTFQLIATVTGAPGVNVVNTATVDTPANIPELDSSDNSATDSDAILPEGVFRNGFETPPAAKLGVPASAKTATLFGKH